MESIPDFRAELVRFAVFGEEEWGEWIWRGTKEDGTPFEERGVTIMGIRDGQIDRYWPLTAYLLSIPRHVTYGAVLGSLYERLRRA